MRKKRKEKAPQISWRGHFLLSQPKFGARHFELRHADRLIAVMTWTRWLSDQAEVKSSGGRWLLDRVGFLRQETIIREAESGRQLGSYQQGIFGDGDLELADGRSFRWQRIGAFRNDWLLVDAAGAPVMEIKAGMNWFKHEAVVSYQELEPPVDPLLMAMICWYLLFMYLQDAAVAGAAAS